MRVRLERDHATRRTHERRREHGEVTVVCSDVYEYVAVLQVLHEVGGCFRLVDRAAEVQRPGGELGDVEHQLAVTNRHRTEVRVVGPESLAEAMGGTAIEDAHAGRGKRARAKSDERTLERRHAPQDFGTRLGRQPIRLPDHAARST